MAIKHFRVGGRRGLRLAVADDIPNLMAIAGPNGSGKSALLELLWQNRATYLEPGSEAIYVGPNRTWRAGALNDIAVRTLDLDYEQILKQETLPGFQFIAPGGNNWLGGLPRVGSNADDAQALVKTSIARLSNKFQMLVAEEYRRQGNRIGLDSVPDLMAPLSELVETLLPHLRFVKIDSSTPTNIQVLFEPRDNIDGVPPFDIDELSSGEKAAIALFLPFIERQVKVLVKEDMPTVPEGVVPLTVILDEPEIHLHPLLQLNMLEYMRRISGAGQAQFIFTTHSPSMLDGLETSELFLLSPASLAPDNQLTRLSESVEKFEVARAITGSTHLLTRSKPIVFIEGEPDTTHTASDERLIRLVLPQIEHWALLPVRGKGQVLSSVRSMRDAELKLPGIPVFGLVDGDQAAPTGEDTVIAWPVAMIENLLLQADVIAAVLQPYAGIGQRDQSTITRHLDSISAARRDDEIRLRVKGLLPTITIRPEGLTSEQVNQAVDAEVTSYSQKLGRLNVDDIVSTATAEVDEIISDHSELERFHGKKMLRSLYDLLRVSSAGLGWSAFLTELARHAAGTKRVERLTASSVEKIKLYFPAELVTHLESAATVNQDLVSRCRVERAAWEAGSPSSEGREGLRRELMQYGRQLRDAGDTDGTSTAIMQLSARIGTVA